MQIRVGLLLNAHVTSRQRCCLWLTSIQPTMSFFLAWTRLAPYDILPCTSSHGNFFCKIALTKCFTCLRHSPYRSHIRLSCGVQPATPLQTALGMMIAQQVLYTMLTTLVEERESKFGQRSSIGGKVDTTGVSQVVSKVSKWGFALHIVLGHKSHESHHGKAAILDLLDLHVLKFVSFLGESHGVKCSTCKSHNITKQSSQPASFIILCDIYT
jgi:hypothetical protein